MADLKRLRRVIEELQEEGIDSDDVYVDPDSVHVVRDDEDDTE